MTAVTAKSHRTERAREMVQSKPHGLNGIEADPALYRGLGLEVRQDGATFLWEREQVPAACASGGRCVGRQVCEAAGAQGRQVQGAAGTRGDGAEGGRSVGQQVRRAAVREASAGSDRWCAPAFLPVPDPTPEGGPTCVLYKQLNVPFAESG